MLADTTGAVAAETGRRKLDEALPPQRHRRWALAAMFLAAISAAAFTLTPRAGLNALRSVTAVDALGTGGAGSWDLSSASWAELASGISGEGGKLRGAERGETRAQTGFDFRPIRLAAGKPGFIGLHGFVARVISGQAAEISGEMPQFHGQVFKGRQRRGQAASGGRFTLRGQTSGESVFESQIIRRAESGEPGLK